MFSVKHVTLRFALIKVNVLHLRGIFYTHFRVSPCVCNKNDAVEWFIYVESNEIDNVLPTKKRCVV